MTITRKKACIILDVGVLLLVGILFLMLFIRPTKAHTDVDRLRFPVKGIDVSAHNGNIDFHALLADTVSFVIIKATEGTDFCDANFNVNYTEARQAGMYIGAYHFFRFDSPGIEQARHFLLSIQGKDFDLPLAIDVEKWGNAREYDTEEVKKELRSMIRYINSNGYPTIIYTNKKGYEIFVGGDFDDVPLWICSLSGEPTSHPWKLWQHSHQSHTKGIKGYVDLNTFKGDYHQFGKWAAAFEVDSLRKQGTKTQ